VACASAAEWTKNTNHFISYWNNCVISVHISLRCPVTDSLAGDGAGYFERDERSIYTWHNTLSVYLYIARVQDGVKSEKKKIIKNKRVSLLLVRHFSRTPPYCIIKPKKATLLN
jgi:hypothetical protein